jgi:hypothetical protein
VGLSDHRTGHRRAARRRPGADLPGRGVRAVAAGVITERLIEFDLDARSLSYEVAAGLPWFIAGALSRWSVLAGPGRACTVRIHATLTLRRAARPLSPALRLADARRHAACAGRASAPGRDRPPGPGQPRPARHRGCPALRVMTARSRREQPCAPGSGPACGSVPFPGASRRARGEPVRPSGPPLARHPSDVSARPGRRGRHHPAASVLRRDRQVPAAQRPDPADRRCAHGAAARTQHPAGSGRPAPGLCRARARFARPGTGQPGSGQGASRPRTLPGMGHPPAHDNRPRQHRPRPFSPG